MADPILQPNFPQDPSPTVPLPTISQQELEEISRLQHVSKEVSILISRGAKIEPVPLDVRLSDNGELVVDGQSAAADGPPADIPATCRTRQAEAAGRGSLLTRKELAALKKFHKEAEHFWNMMGNLRTALCPLVGASALAGENGGNLPYSPEGIARQTSFNQGLAEILQRLVESMHQDIERFDHAMIELHRAVPRLSEDLQ